MSCFRACAPTLIAITASAAEPVYPYAGPMRPFSLRDLGFEKAPEDEYVESLGFTASFPGTGSADISLVVTNLGLGDDNAGVKSDVTLHGRTEKHNEEVDDNWSYKPGSIRMAKTRVDVAANLEQVHIVNETENAGADLTFRRTARAWRPRAGETRFGKKKNLFYEFSLPMPLAEVTGRLRIGSAWVSVQGTGYIDHSRTNIYSHKQAHRWTRFRGIAHGSDGDHLIQLSQFVTTPEYGAKTIGWLVVLNRQGLLRESYDYLLTRSDLRPDREHKNYKVAWRYDVRDGAALSGYAKATKQRSRTDYLASMGALKRMIVSQFAKPITVGLRCDFEFLLQGKNGAQTPLRGSGSMSQTFVK